MVAPGRAGAAVGAAARAVQVAADGQVVQVVARPLRAGPVLAVAGGRAVDDPRVDGLDRLVPDAQPVDHAGTEALDDHVGGLGQAQEGGPTGVGLQVEADPAHAPVGRVGVEDGLDLDGPGPGRRPDLDHVGAVVRQPAGRAGRRADGREVQHAHAGERPRRRHRPPNLSAKVDLGGDWCRRIALGTGAHELEVLGEAELAPGDDVLLDLGGAAPDGVDDRVAVGRLGPTLEREPPRSAPAAGCPVRRCPWRRRPAASTARW